MSIGPTTLADALPREQARVRKAIGIYRDLPNGAGTIGALLMEADLATADRAVASGDVVAMIRAYETLRASATDIGHDDPPEAA